MQVPLDSRPRCVILGEALVDRLPQGPVLGGAPFNVARHLAAFGEVPVLVTRIGRDADGERIAAACERVGLPDWGLQRDDRRPTGSVEVLMEDGGHRFVIGRHQAWDAIDATAACAAVRRAQPQIVYFGSLAQREATSRTAIRAALEAIPAVRFLDLNLREGADDAGLLRASIALAHVLKLNEAELARVLDEIVAPGAGRHAWGSGAQRGAMQELLRRAPLRRVIVTRGEQGYAAFDAQGHLVAQGLTPAADVVDTVGAGDAFSSVCLMGLARQWPLAQTLARAAEFAAAVCTLAGAVTEDAAFYTPWRTRWRLASNAQQESR